LMNYVDGTATTSSATSNLMMDQRKLRKYRSYAEVDYALVNGTPIAVVLYGTALTWTVGVIISQVNKWYFCPIVFDTASPLEDTFGFTYFGAERADRSEEIVLWERDASNDEVVPDTINGLPLWAFGLMLPNALTKHSQQFCLIQEDWLKLRSGPVWSYL
jgi:hypothetical protein